MRTVRFDGRDSWEFYELLTLEIYTPEPQMKESSIEVPGRDSKIDTSEAISGHPTFHNRSLRFRFRAIGDDCQKLRSRFVSDVHGQKKMIEVEDEDHFYRGRCTVRLQKNMGHYLDFVVDVDAEPYKVNEQPITISVEVYDSDNISFYNNGDNYPVPTFTLSAPMEIGYYDPLFEKVEWVKYTEGTHTATFALLKGLNSITVEGAGTIEIRFQEGFLV